MLDDIRRVVNDYYEEHVRGTRAMESFIGSNLWQQMEKGVDYFDICLPDKEWDNRKLANP